MSTLESKDWYLPLGPGADSTQTDPFHGDINGVSSTRLNNIGWCQQHPDSVMSMHLITRYVSDMLARKGESGIINVQHVLPSGEPWIIPVMTNDDWAEFGWRGASTKLPIEASWMVQYTDPNAPNYYDIAALVGAVWEGLPYPGDQAYAEDALKEMIDLSGGFLPSLLACNVTDDIAFNFCNGSRAQHTGLRTPGAQHLWSAGSGAIQTYVGAAMYDVPLNLQLGSGHVKAFSNAVDLFYWASNTITRPSTNLAPGVNTRIHVADPQKIAPLVHSRACWPSLLELSVDDATAYPSPLKNASSAAKEFIWADAVGSEGFVDRFLSYSGANVDGEEPLNDIGGQDGASVLWIDLVLHNTGLSHGGIPWIFGSVQHEEANREGSLALSTNYLPVKREFRRDHNPANLVYNVFSHAFITATSSCGTEAGHSVVYDVNWNPIQTDGPNGFAAAPWTAAQLEAKVTMTPLEGYPVHTAWATYSPVRTSVTMIPGIHALSGLRHHGATLVLDSVAQSAKARYNLKWHAQDNRLVNICSTTGVVSPQNYVALPAIPALTFTGATLFQDVGGYDQYYDWPAAPTTARASYSGAHQADPNSLWSIFVCPDEPVMEWKLYEAGGAFNFDITPSVGFNDGRVISELETRMATGDPGMFSGASQTTTIDGLGYHLAILDLPRGLFINDVQRYETET